MADSRRLGLVAVALLLCVGGVVALTAPSIGLDDGGADAETPTTDSPAATTAGDCGCGPPMHLEPWGTDTPENGTTASVAD